MFGKRGVAVYMKTVMITGAGRGLGKELAYEYARREYSLILHSKETELPNIQAEKVYGDIEDFGTLNKLKEVAETKSLDILINNAGVYLKMPFSDMTIADCRQSIETNLLSHIFLTNLIWPMFKEKKSGLIININSLAGQFGSEGESSYCASKHGLRGFSDAIKPEGIKYGIRVFDVYLGAMKTDMTDHREDWNNLICPQEVARLVVDVCRRYKTMRVSEITINRSIYDN